MTIESSLALGTTPLNVLRVSVLNTSLEFSTTPFTMLPARWCAQCETYEELRTFAVATDSVAFFCVLWRVVSEAICVCSGTHAIWVIGSNHSSYIRIFSIKPRFMLR